jgi:hypothetical protein
MLSHATVRVVNGTAGDERRGGWGRQGQPARWSPPPRATEGAMPAWGMLLIATVVALGLSVVVADVVRQRAVALDAEPESRPEPDD